MSKSHVIPCSAPDCRSPAAYKIAARWSDGNLAELKTYGFACSEHIGAVFRESEERRSDYVPSPGESIEELAIYRYEPGKRDRFLQRWGGWKTIIDRDGGSARPKAAGRAEVTRPAERSESMVASHLRYERSDWCSHREAYYARISVDSD